MTRLSFHVEWTDAADAEAFGPEIPTWSRFRIEVDGRPLTRCVPTSTFSSTSPFADDAVTGPLSGIAEWVVDHFAEILWECPVPFPKTIPWNAGGPAVPGLRDAAAWWSRLRASGHPVELNALAAWQGRHTFGLAASQLGLPSLVFVAERDRIGLFADGLAEANRPNIRMVSEAPSEHWLDREELRVDLARFVEGVIARASASEDGAHWSSWVSQRWDAAQAVERDPTRQRTLEFGPIAAGIWDEVERQPGIRQAVEGLLSDVRSPQSSDEMDCLLHLADAPKVSRGAVPWRKLRKDAEGLRSPQPAHEGYRLAVRTREELRLGVEPIERTDVVLAQLGISEVVAPSQQLFRSAAVARDGHARVVVAQENRSLAAQRAARAAALGRILFDSRSKGWGAAFGSHSRWIETRRATAFAAELLAPAAVVRQRYMDNPDGLADDYGISREAAQWRIFNARQSQEWATA